MNDFLRSLVAKLRKQRQSTDAESGATDRKRSRNALHSKGLTLTGITPWKVSVRAVGTAAIWLLILPLFARGRELW